MFDPPREGVRAAKVGPGLRRRATRGLRPTVEAMEGRVMLTRLGATMAAGSAPEVQAAQPIAPSATSAENARYLSSLEELMAGGPLAPGRHAALQRVLDAGRSREAVVHTLERTPEVAGSRVDFTYRILLNRPPTAVELANGIALLRAGNDARRLMVILAGTTEFYRKRSGGTNAGFVAALYKYLLGRPASANEIAGWVKPLSGLIPRALVAQALLRTPEALAKLAAGATIALPSTTAGNLFGFTYRDLIRPGVLDRLTARAYGSDAFYASALVTTTAPSPPAVVNDVTVHPPGTPLAPGFDFASRWVRLDETGVPQINPGITLISAAADGSVWVTGPDRFPGHLYVLPDYEDLGGDGPTWSTVLGGEEIVEFLAISAVSKDLVWAGLFRPDGPQIQSYSFENNTTTTSTPIPVPNRGFPSAISAAADGTVWVLTRGNQLFALNAARDGLDPVNDGGYTITTISVASASNIWAIGTAAGSTTPLLLRYEAGAWKVDPFLPGITPKHVGATSDGAVWAWDDLAFYIRSATTKTWSKLEPTSFPLNLCTPGAEAPAPQPIVPIDLVGAAPISQYRLAALLSDKTYAILSAGIIDQQAVPFPAFTPSQQPAYEYISTVTDSTLPGGIRSEYTNLNFAAGDAIRAIKSAPPPVGVSISDWTIVRNQIISELNLLDPVYKLFNNLNGLAALLQTNSQTALDDAYENVGEAQPSDSSNSATVLFGDMIDALLWAVAAAGLDEGGAVFVSVLASAYGSVLPAFLNDPSDSNRALTAAYDKLKDQITCFFDQTLLRNGQYETAILQDWGKLQAVHAAALGAWAISPTYNVDFVTASQPVYQRFYYQALMPVKWEVAHYPTFYCVQTWPFGYCKKVQVPGFDLMQTQTGTTTVYINDDSFTVPVYDTRFLQQAGVPPDAFGNAAYPAKTLMDKIAGMGFSHDTLLHAEDGWDLKIVTASEPS